MLVGSKYKICKRLGNGVFEKCQTQKFALAEAKQGTKTTKRPRMLSDYGKQFLEKQRVRFTYGLTERKLGSYVMQAGEFLGSDPTLKLLQTLEGRLDNVVYRAGIAPTRRSARQMVSHGHILVNGKKVSIPSYQVSIGEVITMREGSMKKPIFTGIAERLLEHKAPLWLSLNPKSATAEVKGEPTRENTDTLFNLTVLMEYYSR